MDMVLHGCFKLLDEFVSLTEIGLTLLMQTKENVKKLNRATYYRFVIWRGSTSVSEGCSSTRGCEPMGS